ncbi:MAG: type II toxin-antitoxin system RelE/ParE family toxin, partial [Elusimicrobia bacterium]|jgi:mRNA-degrading endonuclease RelE of RelBE toxin-antitoxin system|nr:type II toxin-antitoxin system RelE/ParE family toxin [Elusimicrobiota bacterium]
LNYKQKAYPKYNRVKKKFPEVFRKEINNAEDKIANNPQLGKEKSGDRKDIKVFKFRVMGQQNLLAYQVNNKKKEIIFISIGGHENFYRDLKKYLK